MHRPEPAPPSLAFDTLVIRFTRQIYYSQDESAFQLQVRQAPYPLPGGAFQADIESRLQAFQTLFAQRLTMGQFFSRFSMSSPGLTMDHTLSDLGQALYALLPLAFRQAFPRFVQRVFEKGHGLRLILEAAAGDKADRLLSLPWELLFFENTGAFLARSPRVLVVRRLTQAIRRSPAQMAPPFNLLHIIAHHPTVSQDYWIDERLRQVEVDKLPQAIQPGRYDRVEEPGSIEQMLTALREHPYHIVHFLGHGEVLEDDATTTPLAARGTLRFIDTEHETQWVTGEHLQHLLEFTPTVQLLVLNACHGGANVARSVALELVYHGLPYVVAIQGDILQDAAQPFIEAFYTELQQGSPIDRAVAVGRAAIAAALPQSIDWCLPVLYTNVGLEANSTPREYAERLWQWMSSPQARQRLGIGNLALGGLHTLVGLLLLVSNQTLPSLPGGFANWITGISLVLPIGLTFVFHLRSLPPIPKDWPATTRVAFVIRVLGAATMGMGLTTFYAWLIWLLVMATGFWTVLTDAARLLLIGFVFLPSALCGWALGYSQAMGHTRAFISEARIEKPTFEWGGISVVLGGYLLLGLFWIVRTFAPNFIRQPWGNVWTGALLLSLGYALWREGHTHKNHTLT